MIMFCFVTAAQRMRTSWVKFSLIHFENGTPDLTHVIIFGHGDLIFFMFFGLDHPGDNRHYHPVLIFLRSSILEPCHTTIN